MKTRSVRQILSALLSGTVCFANSGCHSTGVAQRKAQQMENYRALPVETQKRVERGEIENGMDTNAVFIAWGKPTDSFTLEVPGGGERLIWNYEARWAYDFKRVTPEVSTYRFAQNRTVEILHVPIVYVKQSVTFAGGRVVQWKNYDPPVLLGPPGRPNSSPFSY